MSKQYTFTTSNESEEAVQMITSMVNNMMTTDDYIVSSEFDENCKQLGKSIFINMVNTFSNDDINLRNWLDFMEDITKVINMYIKTPKIYKWEESNDRKRLS